MTMMETISEAQRECGDALRIINTFGTDLEYFSRITGQDMNVDIQPEIVQLFQARDLAVRALWSLRKKITDQVVAALEPAP